MLPSLTLNRLEPGAVVAGRYLLQRPIGQGGMGAVWLATHTLLGSTVALKVLRDDLTHQEHLKERLLREGRALGRLRGPHVARVLDILVQEEGPFCLAMEYLEGEDLSALLAREGPLPVSVAADYALQVCEALAEAHAAGIVHRDIKPSNLFLAELPDGSRLLKVLDFGIAKNLDEEVDLTSSAALLGSPRYMAPEQMRSAREADAACDIWAVGMVLFEMLTCEAPYPGSTVLEIFAAILESPPPSIVTRRSGVPLDLDAAIRCCLSRNASSRFASVAALADAIAHHAPEGSASLTRIRAFATRNNQTEGNTDDARAQIPETALDTPAGATAAAFSGRRPTQDRPPQWRLPALVGLGLLLGGGATLGLLRSRAVMGVTDSPEASLAPQSAARGSPAPDSASAGGTTSIGSVRPQPSLSSPPQPPVPASAPTATASRVTGLPPHAAPKATASVPLGSSQKDGAGRILELGHF